MIMATQNPIEYEGTYPLPEAQLDRFMMRLSLGYPSAEAEEAILESQTSGDPLRESRARVELDDVLAMQEAVLARARRPRAAPLRRRTRRRRRGTTDDIYLGASPRAGIALLRAAKALAVLRGRDYVVPQDVKDLAGRVLSHRIILSPEAGTRRARRGGGDRAGSSTPCRCRVPGEMTRPTPGDGAPRRVAVAHLRRGAGSGHLGALPHRAGVRRHVPASPGCWSPPARGGCASTGTRHAGRSPSPATRCALSFRVTLSGSALPGLQDHARRRDRPRSAGATSPSRSRSLGPRASGRSTAGPWPAQRGVYRLPAFTAVVEDPLGLVRARQACRRAAATHRRAAARRSSPPARRASTPALRHGGGRRRLPTRDAWEFRGIRPHVPGEPLNRVDWKSTAKTGSLMLREMEAATDDDVTVLLNGAAADDAGRAARTRPSRSPSGPPARWPPSRCGPGTPSPCCCPSTAGDRSGSRRTRRAGAGCSARSPRLSPAGLARLGPSLRGHRRRPGAAPAAASSPSCVLGVDDGLVRALRQAARAGRRRSPWCTCVGEAGGGAARRRRTTTAARSRRRRHPLRPGWAAATTCARPSPRGAARAPGSGAMKDARPPLRRLLRRPRRDRRGRGRRIATPTIAPLLLAAVARWRRWPAGPGSSAGAPGRSPSSCCRWARTCWRAPRCPCRRTARRRRRTARLLRRRARASGARAYALDVFPLDVAGKADLRLLLSLVVYVAVGLAAFLALSLRRPLPAIVIVLVLPASASPPTSPRATSGRRWRSSCSPAACSSSRARCSASAGSRRRRSPAASPPSLAAVLAFSILGATSVEAGRPLQGLAHVGHRRRRHARASASTGCRTTRGCSTPPTTTRGHARPLAVASYWRANVLARVRRLRRWCGGAAGRSRAPAGPRAASYWVYEVPPRRPDAPGRTGHAALRRRVPPTPTTSSPGAGRSRCSTALPLDLRVSDAPASAVTPPRGPTLTYAVTAVVPELEPTDLIGRGRDYPAGRRAALPRAAVPGAAGDRRSGRRRPLAGRGGRVAGRPRVAGPVRAQRAHRRRRDRPLPDRPRRRGVPAHQLRLLAEAAVSRLPSRPTRRSSSRRTPGTASTSPARWRCCCGSTGSRRASRWASRTGEQERDGVVRRDAERRARLGGGVLPRRRLGAVRPDAGPTHPRRRATRRRAAPAPPPRPARPARSVAGAGGQRPSCRGRARVADRGGPGVQTAPPAPSEPPDPLAVAARRPRRPRRAGRPAARCCAGAACAAAPRRAPPRVVGARSTPTCETTASTCRASQTLDETARLLRERLGVDAGDLPARVQAVLFGGRPATTRTSPTSPPSAAACGDVCGRARAG